MGVAAAVTTSDKCYYFAACHVAVSAPLCHPPLCPRRQAKVNAEAVLGRVVGAITGKKEGENIVDITTTIDLLQVFWEAEKVRKVKNASDLPQYLQKTLLVSRPTFVDTAEQALLL